MRSKSVSPLGTLLTIASVLAVPLLAIFGIPQFVPVVASSSLSLPDRLPVLPSGGSEQPPAFRARDIFAPVGTPLRTHSAPDHPFAAIGAGWSRIDGNGPVAAPVRTSASTKPEPAGTPQEPFTWRMAVAQLNALGIRQFRLEPSVRPEAFRFCCYLAPVGDARVAVRFEAEDAEPLRAVRDVLDQVTQWNAGQR